MTARISAAIAVALVALVPASAQASMEWQAGTIEQSTVSNCNFDPETGIFANAEFQADPARLPRTGEVFYVRTIPGRVGNACGSGMSVHVEIVPPAGVSPAISASTPVRCSEMDIDTGALTDAPGCPQAAQDGIYGVAFDQLTPGGPAEAAPWELPYGKALVIEIPLQSTRALNGAAPTCSRYNGEPPCPAGAGGDSLQFADKVIDGFGSPWLSPYVGLFVEPAAAGGTTTPPPGGGTTTTPIGGSTTTPGAGTTTPTGTTAPGVTRSVLIAAAPKRVKLAGILRGIPIRLNIPQPGSRVIAELSIKRHGKKTIAAKRTIARAGAGMLKLKLKPTRALVRSLYRAGRPVQAVLRVRVVSAGGAARTETARIRLDP